MKEQQQWTKPTLKLVQGAAALPEGHVSDASASKCPPKLAATGQRLLDKMLDEGVIEGDSLAVLPSLPRESKLTFVLHLAAVR